MLNQLPITKNLINALELLCKTAGSGVHCIEKELKTMSESSVKNICIESNEHSRLAIASVNDFIYRATHDEYGDDIK